MKDSPLLDKVLAGMPSPTSEPQQPVAAAYDPAVSGPNRRISALNAGRFDRWNTDPPPPQEDESWLLTYLDVVTLLLAMLVVMLAFSERRVMAVDSPLPIVQTADDLGTTIVPPIPLPHPATAPEQVAGEPVDVREAPLKPAVEVADLGPGVEVESTQGIVRFRISSEVLFASGEAALTPAGLEVIDQLLPAFNQVPDHTIMVEGHSDNIPISTARFPSNWELSASRASAVVRHLETRGLNPTRLRATGMADTKPMAPNDTPEGRSQNRRVEIVMEAPDPLR